MLQETVDVFLEKKKKTLLFLKSPDTYRVNWEGKICDEPWNPKTVDLEAQAKGARLGHRQELLQVQIMTLTFWYKNFIYFCNFAFNYSGRNIKKMQRT